MSVVPHAKLADVAFLNPTLGGRLPDDDLVSFVPMASLSAETAKIETTQDRPYAEVSKGFTPFLSGDVLVAKITPCFENGKIAQALLPRRNGFGSTEFHVVRARPDVSEARYLHHYLRLDTVRTEGQRRMTGSGGQRRVPASFLADLRVPLPPLEDQRRIAAILDQAETLRTQRRQALAHLDTLTQSLFLDMFGDPATNPKRWPVGQIRDLLESASYGTSEKSSSEGEFPVLRMNNLTRTGELDLTDLKYMNLPLASRERYLAVPGDVLFNRTNSAELVGKTAMVPADAPQLAYAGYLVRLRVNHDNEPIYLARFLNSAYAKQMLRSMCKSIVGMANINAKEIQAMKIALPPITLQQTFATRIQAIEALKATHRTALAQLDALFASLQQRAFAGEL